MCGRRFALFCGVALSGLPGPGLAAAEGIPNCYVERVPCGTPEQLAEAIRGCIAASALCGAEGHGFSQPCQLRGTVMWVLLKNRGKMPAAGVLRRLDAQCRFAHSPSPNGKGDTADGDS
jgi:hypothetical protein